MDKIMNKQSSKTKLKPNEKVELKVTVEHGKQKDVLGPYDAIICIGVKNNKKDFELQPYSLGRGSDIFSILAKAPSVTSIIAKEIGCERALALHAMKNMMERLDAMKMGMANANKESTKKSKSRK